MLWTIFLVGMLGTFGLNFPIVLTAMAKSTFGGNASTYGLFNIVLAHRVGGRRAARRGGRPPEALARSCSRRPRSASSRRPRRSRRTWPCSWSCWRAMGFVNLVFQSMANASVQLAVDPELRGRVMGLYMLVFIGGTPFGAPLIGALTSHFGARAGMAVCGVVPVLAAVVVAAARIRPAGGRERTLRRGRLGLRYEGTQAVRSVPKILLAERTVVSSG